MVLIIVFGSFQWMVIFLSSEKNSRIWEKFQIIKGYSISLVYTICLALYNLHFVAIRIHTDIENLEYYKITESSLLQIPGLRPKFSGWISQSLLGTYLQQCDWACTCRICIHHIANNSLLNGRQSIKTKCYGTVFAFRC